MSRALTVELSDRAYAALERCARDAARSPTELAAATLEESFSIPERKRPATESEKQDARSRFERHFGAVDLGHSTNLDNEAIDADLARAYADTHEGA